MEERDHIFKFNSDLECDNEVESDGFMEYNVETYNRFKTIKQAQSWSVVEPKHKRKRVSTGSEGSPEIMKTEQFAKLSMADKLVSMFDSINTNTRMLSSVISGQSQCVKDMSSLKSGMNNVDKRLSSVEQHMD